MKAVPVDACSCSSAGPLVLGFGRCALRLDTRELLVEGRPCEPGPLLTRLLIHFLDNPGRVVSREELLDAVWLGRWVRQDVVSRTVMKLRRLICRDAGDDLIWTIHGQGYRFVAPICSAKSTDAPDTSELTVPESST